MTIRPTSSRLIMKPGSSAPEIRALMKAVPPLPQGLTNPYLRLFTLVHGDLPESSQDWGGMLGPGMELMDLRDDARALYAFAVPDEAALRACAKVGPILEVGAGSGYWAALLRARRVDVLAVDKYRSKANPWHRSRAWTEVLPGGPETAAAHPDRTLMLCWPPYDAPMAARTLAAYAGPKLIFIGQPAGRATATKAFYEALERDWGLVSRRAIPSWYKIGDTLGIWRRRKPASGR